MSDSLYRATGYGARSCRAVPKDTMNFADFPFGESVPAFPNTPRRSVLEYLQRFAAEHQLLRRCELGTLVARVAWDAAAAAWAVTSCAASGGGGERTRHFAHVAVASGHHAQPIMPELEGSGRFPGRVMHSCSFDSADEFAGQHVLVIGGSVSAGQIAELLHGSGLCAAVHLSTRKPTAEAYRATTAGAVAAARKAGVPLHAELRALAADGSARFVDGSEVPRSRSPDRASISLVSVAFSTEYRVRERQPGTLLTGRSGRSTW